ncbi:hypothetical protein ACM66B_006183 [Microbotryomycetes sp. NB124-2]
MPKVCTLDDPDKKLWLTCSYQDDLSLSDSEEKHGPTTPSLPNDWVIVDCAVVPPSSTPLPAYSPPPSEPASYYGVTQMPALSSTGPINSTFQRHVMSDLLHSKNLKARVDKFLDQLNGGDKRDGFIMPTTLKFIFKCGNYQELLPVFSIGVLVLCMGIWTTDGAPSLDDTANGLTNITRDRLELPIRRKVVYTRAPDHHGLSPPDAWGPEAWHENFDCWGEATSWKLHHGRDFPEGLPVVFVFDKARLRSIRARFKAYEHYGEGIGRSRIEPGMRLSPATSPVVFKPQTDQKPGQLSLVSSPNFVTSSISSPQDSLWLLSRYIGEFLMTIGGIHWVPSGWKIVDDFNSRYDAQKTFTIVGGRLLHAGLDQRNLQRVWRGLPELPKLTAWTEVMHTMPAHSLLDRMGLQRSTTQARWTFSKREFAQDRMRAQWRKVVATEWQVEDFPISGRVTIRFI